ncbi:tetratricopeptide repeat protein [Chelativorans sp.]|uniref:tetratricopeptide repeat protein n=1 Tax=Chelativorans sp. TaxID=2203393 RepID=UPI0028120A64|nr:FecR domain-containing protein [Chelativorans sp.]
MRRFYAALLAVAWLDHAVPVEAEVVARGAPAAGAVIARKTGEEVRFFDVSNWRGVDIGQDVLAGDTLRTNATGQLAILFSDRTQMRMGRNTVLVVKQIGAPSETVFDLQAGVIWGRAQRGGIGLTVETPAAAAAVRGTDWTLTVEADGRTSLIVLEGLVELSNELGSVSVAAGEAAVAAIGQAPTKVVIVDPKDRDQMLFHLSLRNSFTFLPASPLPMSNLRNERARIVAAPPAQRSAEDWTTLAEAALVHDSQQAALDAIAGARRRGPTPQQAARLDLVEAMVTGARQNYAEAARLFERAERHLDPERRAVAAYGGYYARALADPDSVEAPPSTPDGGPAAAMAEAWTAGFLYDIQTATEVLQRGERRFPRDPLLPAMRAQLAMLIDDRQQTTEAIERALLLDPDNAEALKARARFRANFQGDIEGAYADLSRAAELMPGSTDLWNDMGLVQSARGAAREAEAAFRRAAELDPNDPVAHANLAIFLLDQDRLEEAKREIDTALALDPAFEIGLVARGRYYLQRGDRERALQDLLAGSTANPGYAQALLLLAAAHYESGDTDPGNQAIENADRLDPNDPVTSSFRTAIAIDDYDADAAVESAQEALRRSRARGGDYAPLSANRDAGSTLNDAFRTAGLDAWGRYYGDAVFDPFAGASFIDQTISGSADPFVDDMTFGGNPVDATANSTAFSSFFQGLMLSPEMLAGRSRGANLFRRPFIEGAIEGGFIEGSGGWTGGGEVQTYAAEPFPWSFYGIIDAEKASYFREAITPGAAVPYVGFNLESETFSGTGYFTARPTPYDRVAAYVDVRKAENNLADTVVLFNLPGLLVDGAAYDRSVDTSLTRVGAGWSHTFGYRNVLNAAAFYSGISQTSAQEGLLFVGTIPVGLQTEDATMEQQSFVAAVSHSIGVENVSWRYGIEAGMLDQSRTEESFSVTILDPPTLSTAAADAELAFGRAYVDAIYEFTPTFQAEAGIFVTALGDPIDKVRLEPRIGFAWAPIEGHWLRAAYQRQTESVNETTLSPVGVLGLQPNQLPLDIGGYTDTLAFRWDAEWTDRFFTSVDYQHQWARDIAIQPPDEITTVSYAKGRLDRVSATANLRLGFGLGAFATAALTDSEDLDPTSPTYGSALPFIPETAARLGLTWVHPSNIKVTLAATYVGERFGNEFGDVLDDYWTADAFLTWEPLDKRFALELAGYNLLDEDFQVASGVPGWGRTFTGSLKVRF